jgi:translation initiation factor 1
MARGTKLDLNIGAHFNEGWAEVQTSSAKKVSSDILEPSQHFLHFKREKRRGKVVTLVGPFQMKKADVTPQLKQLKKKLGCGGSYKEHFMEFQGELQEKLKALLTAQEFRFKR